MDQTLCTGLYSRDECVNIHVWDRLDHTTNQGCAKTVSLNSFVLPAWQWTKESCMFPMKPLDIQPFLSCSNGCKHWSMLVPKTIISSYIRSCRISFDQRVMVIRNRIVDCYAVTSHDYIILSPNHPAYHDHDFVECVCFK